MAKVIAPFIIKGTLNGINFYVADNGDNLAREKGKPGVSAEQFKNNPIFQKVKNHAKEFGHCTKKAQNFRMTALQFFRRAKDGSFAGRANKLMLDVLNEDTLNPHRERTVENGMESAETRSYFIGFEGNKLRPLSKTLKTDWSWNELSCEFQIINFNPEKHLDWPDKAQQAHLALAYVVWNYNELKFTTAYSEEIIIKKSDDPININLKTERPPVNDNELELAFLFIGFSYQDHKKTIELKRSFNTASIIWSK